MQADVTQAGTLVAALNAATNPAGAQTTTQQLVAVVNAVVADTATLKMPENARITVVALSALLPVLEVEAGIAGPTWQPPVMPPAQARQTLVKPAA